MKLVEVVESIVETAETVVKKSLTVEGAACPKCSQNTLIKTPMVGFSQTVVIRVFGITIKLPVSVKFGIQYCPNCGYLAVKGGE